MNWLKTFGSFLWCHPGHLFWVALAYIPCLGLMSISLTGDQKIYLSTALEMREYGSWLQPILFGEPSYYKPPFQYWMTLLGWKTVGFNLWGALLPSVICVILTGWLLGEIAALLQEHRHFVNAGLWFAVALGTVTYGTTAQMEIYLCLFYTASWWTGLQFLSKPTEERSMRWLYLAFALAGIAALVKSPLYSVFWVVGFLSYLVISGEWELFKNRHLYLALLLGVLLGTIWYASMLIIDRQRFLADYVIRENLGKSGGNQGSVWNLWSSLLYFCFPFTLFILPALRSFWKGRHTGGGLRFLMGWAWPPVLFFSLYPYRIKPYAFILVPLFAILVDWGYFRAGRTRFYRLTIEASSVLFFFLFSALGLFMFRSELAPLWVAIGFCATGIWFLFCGLKDWMRGMALCALMGIFLFRMAAISLGEQDLFTLREVHKTYPNAPIAFLDEKKNIWHDVGLVSAALSTPIQRLNHLDTITEFLQKGGVVILEEDQAEQYQKTIQAKLLGRGDLRVLLETPWHRWKKRTKFPYGQLIRKGRQSISNFDFDEMTKRLFKILILK